MYRILGVVLILVILPIETLWGKTLMVEGDLDAIVKVQKNVNFSVETPLNSLSYQFPIPATVQGMGTNQNVTGFSATVEPQPTFTKDETDKFGNKSRKVTWNKLNSDARINISYTAAISSTLSPQRSSSLFPIKDIPEELKIFLSETPLVQSNDPRIKAMAKKLTSDATTCYSAVNSILNYVSDAISYQFTPPKYDALYGLETGKGNCQNYAHLAIALLRASAIPARLVIGVTLKDQWKIPIDEKGSSVVQGMGEGLHAWVEVYLPDLGWLPCDPQQSRFFTSTRHIKYGHGLDAGDVKETWSGNPSLPRFAESIDAHYLDDKVKLHLRATGDQPGKRYMVSATRSTEPAAVSILPVPPVQNLLPPTPKPIVTLLKPVPVEPVPVMPKPAPEVKPTPVTVVLKPAPVVPSPPIKADKIEPPSPLKIKSAPKVGTPVEFGNLEFPTLLETYKVSGSTGTRSFERETAEYATSQNVFAQAFTVEHPVSVAAISLAMKKFGGDGMVFLDLVADENGKPSIVQGVRSEPISLDKIRREPGYAWINFAIPSDTKPLPPGKYWIVLRHSGSAIMNWFYTPGKGYGTPDDTRSTARGWQWEDVLTYDFVFKVTGVIANLNLR